MTWITDNPIPLLILGLIAQVILGVILWTTGRGWAMVAMIVLAVTNVALLVAEYVMISPTEEVTARLHEMANTLATNESDQVLECIVPEAAQLRNEIAMQLRRVKINEAVVTSQPIIEFATDANSQRPTATAQFFGRVKAKFLRDSSPYEQMAARYTIFLRQEPDGKWLVTGYEINRW